jgi:hypothetical protein
MIYYFTPYSLEKKLFKAIDQYINLLPNDDDWACLMDGDTMFLSSDFGHQIQVYIDKYPDTGLFTCYTNRCHYDCQRYSDGMMNQSNIIEHKLLAKEITLTEHGEVSEINRRIAGHLMIIKKATWKLIRPEVERKVIQQHKQILGVDTKISNAILHAGLKIRLMQGVYIFHFLRMDRSIDDKSHLC